MRSREDRRQLACFGLVAGDSCFTEQRYSHDEVQPEFGLIGLLNNNSNLCDISVMTLSANRCVRSFSAAALVRMTGDNARFVPLTNSPFLEGIGPRLLSIVNKFNNRQSRIWQLSQRALLAFPTFT
ncbi:MAG TPA: hypothetical protein VJM31_18060 [Vicinamibacterales bacterium]|nr:hypothetical protein [Vicinamibacterales bacterium]